MTKEDISKAKKEFLKRFHPKLKHKHQQEILELDSQKIKEMKEIDALEEKYEKIRIRKRNKKRKQLKKQNSECLPKQTP